MHRICIQPLGRDRHCPQKWQIKAGLDAEDQCRRKVFRIDAQQRCNSVSVSAQLPVDRLCSCRVGQKHSASGTCLNDGNQRRRIENDTRPEQQGFGDQHHVGHTDQIVDDFCRCTAPQHAAMMQATSQGVENWMCDSYVGIVPAGGAKFDAVSPQIGVKIARRFTGGSLRQPISWPPNPQPTRPVPPSRQRPVGHPKSQALMQNEDAAHRCLQSQKVQSLRLYPTRCLTPACDLAARGLLTDGLGARWVTQYKTVCTFDRFGSAKCLNRQAKYLPLGSASIRPTYLI